MLGGGLGCGLNEPAEGCGVWGKTFGGPVGVIEAEACSASFGVPSVDGAIGAEAESEELPSAAGVAAGAAGAAGVTVAADAASCGAGAGAGAASG